jgi:uracil-DNA glycosylase
MIISLIERLAGTAVSSDVCNQYADGDTPGNAVRRKNLALYLEQTLAHGPALILVGEAPGYLGCLRTGVPFTSEQILLNGLEPPGIFGASRGFQRATHDGRTPGEQTATIVWRELQRHGVAALGWNAWPFHPHRPGLPQSNRAPRAAELRQGLPFLQALLALAPALPVVAMGNSAAHNLAVLQVRHTKIRHPAQGGARSFAEGLRAVLGGNVQ